MTKADRDRLEIANEQIRALTVRAEKAERELAAADERILKLQDELNQTTDECPNCGIRLYLLSPEERAEVSERELAAARKRIAELEASE